MRMMKKAAVILAALGVCMGLGGCALLKQRNNPSAEEVVNIVLNAYAQADYEGMKTYTKEDERLSQLLGAVGREDASDMEKVYQQVFEATKGFTYTAEAVEGKEKWGEVLVKIQTNDVSAHIMETMSSAITAQAENGDDSFGNLPAWLLQAVQISEPKELEVTVHVSSVSSEKIMDVGTNREFFEVLTGGFYEYMDLSMTTCTADGDVYEIASNGDDIIGMVETMDQMEDTADLTDEDIKAYEELYAGMEGLTVRVQRKETEGITIRFGVDFETASSKDLADLGIISDRITAGGGYLSLQKTISGFEDSGMTCVTDTYTTGTVTE